MNLTGNFTLEELVITDTGLDNEPMLEEKEKLLYLATYILQPIRDRWGALKVTSGFRSMPVNVRVGGSPTSQHVHGEAADVVPMESVMDLVFAWIVKESGLKFGQCIRESKGWTDWIHISLPSFDAPNQQALIYEGKKYKPYE